ncbi:GH36 C-terminal domain-containing protein [Paenibacillus sp. FSL R10-2734]|uniref:GH36 C-terminal domain-containing protein n=1 Tax=Paenibacillus sp. FSL R10-2734 TaxID=2954691 RepID=UPI0030D6E84E
MYLCTIRLVRTKLPRAAAVDLGKRGRNFTSLQYISQDGSESVVFVFRPAQYFAAPAFPVLLRGSKSTVIYRNVETEEVRSG